MATYTVRMPKRTCNLLPIPIRAPPRNACGVRVFRWEKKQFRELISLCRAQPSPEPVTVQLGNLLGAISATPVNLSSFSVRLTTLWFLAQHRLLGSLPRFSHTRHAFLTALDWKGKS